jgi:hypothetical protein
VQLAAAVAPAVIVPGTQDVSAMEIRPAERVAYLSAQKVHLTARTPGVGSAPP